MLLLLIVFESVYIPQLLLFDIPKYLLDVVESQL